MYDVAIIGTGPAGLSAAITLKLHVKSILWFGSKQMSAKVEKSENKPDQSAEAEKKEEE